MVLRLVASAMCAALARAWRAWSTLAKLRRQLDMLGLHLSRWRDEQLQRERWLRDAIEEAPG